jgi:glycosyltransferase involved in cell wall biosynthesis
VRWVVPQAASTSVEPVPHVCYRGTGLVAGLRIAGGPDGVLHSHFALSAWGHALSPAATPRVRTFYGPWAEEAAMAGDASRARSSLRELIEAISLRRAARVVVLSQFSASQARRRGVPEGKLRIIPGFVDPGRFTGPLEARSAGRQAPLLVTNRRLTPRTGVDRLLRALVLLPPRHRRVRLEVLGGGPQRPALEGLSRDLRLGDRVSFRGGVTDLELGTWLSAADLAIVPSVGLEGFGMATVEALWHGSPVVVTRVGANPEVVEGLDPGLVASSSEPEAIAEAIAGFLDRRGDWDRRRARAYVQERYSLDAAVTKTIALYREVLDLGDD